MLKGEVVLLVGPPPAPTRVETDVANVRRNLDLLIEAGSSRSEAVKRVARELGLPKSEVYQIAHAG